MYYNGALIRLRPSERADLPLFVQWLSNPEMRQYLILRYISQALEERWFEGLVSDLRGGFQPARLHFMIEALEGPRPIGAVGLEDINWRDRSAELGIFIGEPEFWGKGYGSDAVRTTLEVGFRWYNLHRIFLNVVDDNERARRSYEKCGFQLEGRLRKAVFIDGGYKDLLLMSILADEFNAERS